MGFVFVPVQALHAQVEQRGSRAPFQLQSFHPGKACIPYLPGLLEEWAGCFGSAELLRVVNATDAGQIIDPPGLENQLNGCLGSAGFSQCEGHIGK